MSAKQIQNADWSEVLYVTSTAIKALMIVQAAQSEAAEAALRRIEPTWGSLIDAAKRDGGTR